MDAALNRLRWQCRRGMLELDLLLTAYFDARGASWSLAEREQFARLLDYDDTELWALLNGQTQSGDVGEQGLVERVRAQSPVRGSEVSISYPRGMS